jgi:branched-subunit amino acid permease
VLRVLILALCLLTVLVPLLALVAIVLVAGGITVAVARRIDEPRRDLQRVALLALTPFRAPPAAASL